ncbi:MAG: RHS repeat-associated core domain-containing protein, partial [Geobacteraceae bacterium]|nr:RHS repeat-associated core domain-containing protein [Geobacteraceae bacterium]
FGKLQSCSYLWQGATLAEQYKTINGATGVERWHFEPGTFNPLAKETITPGVGAEKAGEPRFFPIVTDHLGTPKEIFDTDGECLWQAEHELWGKITVKQQKTRPGSHLPFVDCSLRFQNQWEDAETGLFYNLNRYYDPDSGQYLSSDPIGLEGGLRTHGYVHDPMQWVDPLGLAGCPKWDGFANRWRDSKGRFAKVKTEVVQRWMSKTELENTRNTGLLRGGKKGTHYVTNAANSSAKRARQRTALPRTPEVRVTMEVPMGNMSAPTKVNPDFKMPGGGMERTGTGDIPVKIVRVDSKR